MHHWGKTLYLYQNERITFFTEQRDSTFTFIRGATPNLNAFLMTKPKLCPAHRRTAPAAVIRKKKKLGQQHPPGWLVVWYAGGSCGPRPSNPAQCQPLPGIITLRTVLYAQQQSSPVAVLADGGAAAVERVPSAPADLDARLDVRHVSALRAAVVRRILIDAAGGKARGHRVRVCVWGGARWLGGARELISAGARERLRAQRTPGEAGKRRA